MEKTILNQGIEDNKYYRIISEIEEYIVEGVSAIKREYVVKLQIKIFILGFSKYITIKKWCCDYYDISEKDFIKNEANELFDKIINPYKV